MPYYIQANGKLVRDLIQSSAEAIDMFGEDELEQHPSYIARVLSQTRDLEEQWMDAQDILSEMRAQRGEDE